MREGPPPSFRCSSVKWLSVDVLAVSHPDDEHDECGITNCVDDPIVALPDTIPILVSRKFFDSLWSRILSKRVNGARKAYTNVCRKPGQLLTCGT
jgi:hypothetical protein